MIIDSSSLPGKTKGVRIISQGSDGLLAKGWIYNNKSPFLNRFKLLRKKGRKIMPHLYTPGGTPYNGLYREAPPERGTFFRLEVYKRVGISRAKYRKGLGKLSFRY